MIKNPTYEELKHGVRELERGTTEHMRIEEKLRTYTQSFDNMGERVKAEKALRETEETLQKAHDQLERMVEERTAGLIKANTQLKREIEERRKTEEELRRSEEKYRNLIEQANDGIIITQDGNVRFVNQRMADLLGYTREEMTSTPQIRYVHPDLVSDSIERRRRHTVDVPVETTHENILRHKGGADIYVEVNAVAILFEGKMSNLVFVRDLTERKRAEQALKESELKYASLVEQATDGIFIIQDGVFKFANEAIAKLLGYTVDELLGRSFFEMVAPESKEMIAERYSLRISGENGVPNHYDAKSLRRDGTIIDVEVSARRFQYQGKSASLGFLHDITARKQFETAMKLKEKELEVKTGNLEETNTALTVLLKKREEDKLTLQEQVLSNVKKLVIPYIDKLKQNQFNGSRITNLALLETSLNDIISPFTHKLSTKYLNLTPAEIKVADLVKQGRTTKEIADLLSLSYKTIERHRENIRGKIGIKNSKVNLQSHLSFFQ